MQLPLPEDASLSQHLALIPAIRDPLVHEFKKTITLDVLKVLGGKRGAGPTRDTLMSIVKSEHKRRVKLKQQTAAMICDLAIQLSVMEEKERAIGALLARLDLAARQVVHKRQEALPVVSTIVDELRNVQTGALPFRKRTATGFGRALEGLIPQQAWNQVSNTLSSRLVCQVFMEGKEAVTFQQLAVRNNLLVSLDQIACMSQQDMAVLYKQYMAAVEATLPRVFDPDVEAAAFAQEALARLLKESSLIRVAHVIGQQQNMNVFAKQEPASIPIELLRRVAEAGGFTDEQLLKMWGLWKECISTMTRLKEEEQQVHTRLQSALQQALSSTTRNSKYVALVDAAAEMSRNLEAQASTMFRLNCQCAISVLHPLQCARMHLTAAPLPLRIHLLFLSGLVPRPPG